MKNFYSLDYDEYPKNVIKLRGSTNESYKCDDLTKVVIEENNNENVIRYLILPFHRYNTNYYTILLSNEKITIKELTDIIYNFYNKKELSLLDLKNLDADDAHEYITEMTIAKKENPKLIVHPIDIMGDKKFLERITIYEDESGDVQYMLHLGS